MRVLSIPQVSTGEVAAESDVGSHLTLQRAILQIEPSFFYMWLRKRDAGKMMPGVSVELLYHEIERDFYRQMATADLSKLNELFNWGTGVFPIDVVFTSRVGVAPLLTLALGLSGAGFDMPVVLTEPKVFGPGEVGHNAQTPAQLAVRAAGYASCFGIYWSEWEKRAALAAAEQFCAPAVLKGWDERAFVCNYPVAMPPQSVLTGKRATHPKRILFAGRLNANKRWREVLNACQSVVQSRPSGEVEVWMHSGTGAFDKLGATQHRWHRTSERLSRDKYWEVLGSAHVGAYLSNDEGANATVLELLAAGVVMILPDRTWTERMFSDCPMEYPYIASSERQLKPMLDWLLDDYEEAHTRLAPIRDWIAEKRGWGNFMTSLRAAMETIRNVPRPEPYRMFREIVTQATGGRDGIGFRAAMQAMGTPPLSHRQARSMYACYAAVRDLDDLSSGDPWIKSPGLADQALSVQRDILSE